MSSFPVAGLATLLVSRCQRPDPLLLLAPSACLQEVDSLEAALREMELASMAKVHWGACGWDANPPVPSS